MGWGIVYPPYSVINMGAVQPPTPTTRWVYNFNGVDSYIALSQTISIGNGGWMSAEFIYANASKINQTIFGLSDSFLNFLHIISSTSIRIRVNGTIYDYAVSEITEGSSNKIRVDFNAGQSPSLALNGVSYQSSNNSANTEAFEFNVLAQKVSSEFFNGTIYNYQDSLGNNLPINDRTFGVGAPIANSATVLGGELWLNPALGDWLDNGDGSYTLNGDGSYQPLGQIAINSNDTYLVEITVDALNGGTLSAYNQATHRALTVGKNVLLIAGGSRLDIVRLNGAITATVRNISLKKANGYATGVNLLESGWQEINI